ncbi:MAG: hypothetical protein LBG95_09055 [Treponema sp.]|jgi:hypothetical protein|nr:hypothetical protein [Treponema sp.]
MGYEYGNNNNYGTNYGSDDSTIGSVLTLGVVGVGLYFTFLAVVFIGQTLFTAVVSLTIPALIKSFVTFSAAELSVIRCLTVALEGVFTGLFIGCLRRLYIKSRIKKRYGGKHSMVGSSLISELLTFEVFNFEINLVSVILLNMLVGFGVGWVQGAAGISGLIQAILSKGNVIFNSSIIGSLIAGGGAGGAGTGSPFSFVLFIIIIFIVQGIITGAATGLTAGVLFGAISGAIKKGSIELLFSPLADVEKNRIGKGKRIAGSAIKGVIEGAVVGGIVGLIQGIITLIVVSPSKR